MISEQEKQKALESVKDIRFDLTDLYSGLNDPALERDLQALVRLCEEFEKAYRGKLSSELGAAIEDLQAIQRLNNKISVFLHLNQSCNASDQKVQQWVGKAREVWARASANHLTFFEQEVGRQLSEEAYQALLSKDEVAQHHKPFLDHIRKCAKHLLSEQVERALMLREPFGSDEWSDLFDETEVSLNFSIKNQKLKDENFWGKKLNLSKMVDLMLHHDSSDVRYEAMRVLNSGLKKDMAAISGRAFNLVMGTKNVEDDERGYPHVMAQRNLNNRVSDEVVEALHNAVVSEGPKYAKRFYKLLAKHLKKDKLLWSDRTASPLPKPSKVYSWDESYDIVQAAYRAFSPFLADIVHRMAERRWIDAPPYVGKISGAFNYAVDLPEPHGVRSYTFLNFLGSERDVMVIAHELGHAVHGVLAAHEQGALMFRAPLVYAETASIFGEMLTFNYLLKQAQDNQAKLVLYMEKCSDFVSSVLRQIGFSLFERRIHSARRNGKLTSDDFRKHWMETTEQLYGKNGEVFDYSDMDYLWTYVSHFLNPFYVYSYAFGELLTQSLFAVKDKFQAHEFQTLYLDLLKAGGTKDAVELLKPFGLNPADPSFWSDGLRDSLGLWLREAERLSGEII